MAIRWFVIATVVVAMSQRSWTQEADVGKIEYLSSCAACHGADGKGTGPVSTELKPATPDLTVLAKNNNGVFPLKAANEIIDGTKFIKAHGTREMPIWGLRYVLSSSIAEKYLNQSYDPKIAIIDYLNRIQER